MEYTIEFEEGLHSWTQGPVRHLFRKGECTEVTGCDCTANNPFIWRSSGWMHDSIGVNTTRTCSDYLEEGFKGMEQLARLPDLHLIENIWDLLYRRIHSHQTAPCRLQHWKSFRCLEGKVGSHLPYDNPCHHCYNMGYHWKCFQGRGGHILFRIMTKDALMENHLWNHIIFSFWYW